MAYAVHTRSCTYLLDDDGICRWTLAPTGVQVPGAERYLGAQFVACLDVREIGGLVGELRNGAAALFARSENGRLVLLRTPSIEFVEHRSDESDASDFAPAVARSPDLPSYVAAVEPLPTYVPRATAAPPPPALPSYPPRPAATLPPLPPRPLAAPPAPTAPPVLAPRTLPPLSPPAYRAPPPPEPRQPAPTAALPELAPLSTDTLPIAPMRHWPVAPPRQAYPEPYASEPEIEPEEEYLSELDVEAVLTFSEVTLTIPLYRPEAQTTPPAPRRNVIGPGRRLR